MTLYRLLHFILRILTSFLLVFGIVGLSGGAESNDEDVYSVVHGWPQLPAGRILGQATGVAVDSHNHVFVFHRAGREWSDPFPEAAIESATVAVFDNSSGKLMAEWGQDLFIMPHGLSVDHEDNVWVTDVGRHQVFKFSHDGELLLTLGENRVPGDDANHFNLPTDVATLTDGSFFVSDGYANSRVAKFASDGRFQFQWGAKGTGEGQLDLPHGIAVDSDSRVYVADRSNSRVQVFNREGNFISQWKGPEIGRPYAVAIGPDNKAYVVDGGDQPIEPPDRSKAMRLSLNGDVEATFGRYGNYDGQFLLGHDIAVGKDGAVYVVDAWGMRVQKFVATADQ
jgi:peptidylamidoglycolate lyase